MPSFSRCALLASSVAAAFLTAPNLAGQTRVPTFLRGASQAPLTTSSRDVELALPMLDDYDPTSSGDAIALDRSASGAWWLEEGVFGAHLEGYCLQPGASRGRGDIGYGDAPLKGPLADVIHNILRNRSLHPNVTQEHTQALIWAIIARTPFEDLPAELQQTGRVLLSNSELRRLGTNAPGRLATELQQRLLESAPSGIRRILEAEARLRDTLSRVSTAYADLERIADLAVSIAERAKAIQEWGEFPIPVRMKIGRAHV